MTAKPIYNVTLIFGVGLYRGEWDGKEEQMRQQYTLLCKTESKKFARTFYKRIAKERLKAKEGQ